MRRTIIIAAAASLGFGTGVANAQDNGAITQRVDRLEGQMRAVQRKVFPGGSAQWVQPQITPAETPTLAGPGSNNPVPDPHVRVHALEIPTQNHTKHAQESTHN